MTERISLPLEGGCHCGALRYQLSAPPIGVYACHCTNCQRITASAFSISCIIGEPSFSFVKGKPARIEWTADSGTKRYGAFCGKCGVRIIHGQEPTNNVLSLRGGTMDDKRWAEPAGHIWTKSAHPWVQFAPDDVIFEGQPTTEGYMKAAAHWQAKARQSGLITD